MSVKYKRKPAGQDEITLYCLIGEAVCMVQLLEDALSTSITLKKEVKKPHALPLEKANEFLEKYRSYTLGDAIKLAQKESIYSEPLLQALKSLGPERNWLIHKCIRNEDDMLSESNKSRIRAIGEKAQILLHSVEADLMQYSSSVGLDISSVQVAIQKHYEES